MRKRAAIVILIVCMNIAAVAAEKAEEIALRDGFVLSGVDGKLIARDGNDNWVFEFDKDISDGRGIIKAGKSVKVLPSQALEGVTGQKIKEAGIACRLWGTVTTYRGRNFIFGAYFLGLSETGGAKVVSPEESEQKGKEIAINEPNDVLSIPAEIIEKLKTKKIIRPAQAPKGAKLKQDYILADRMGFIVNRPDGKSMFVLDALGRNVGKVSFELLPCRALERAERTRAGGPERIRFKAAGIVTKYKGRYYLLLQRARRVYSYGNFDR